MGQNIPLIIHNAASVISAVIGVGLALFVFLNNPRSRGNVMFALLLMCAVVFIVSHVAGVSVSDPELSRKILMFNLVGFLFGMFNLHAILALTGKERSHLWILILTYAVSIGFIVFFLIYPDLFLLPSVPKMYFPEYYNPGLLNWTRIALAYVVLIPYCLYLLGKSIGASRSVAERHQLTYLFATIVVGYSIGFIPNFLVYDIPVDPLWGMGFFVIVAIPLIYGAVRYELFDVKIIAKQAFFYGVGVAMAGGLIALFEYANHLIQSSFPGFPFWIMPLASGVLIVSVAIVIWRQLRSGDLLKYEFITTVTHKFRTPLTHIKWASENLSKSSLSADDQAQVEYIQSAGNKLVELTGLLMNVSGADESGYQYRFERSDLSALAAEVAAAVSEQSRIKKIRVEQNLEPGAFGTFDESRIRFIIQTLIENAVHYTPEGGTISVSVRHAGGDVVFAVKDTGIGIAKDERAHIFTKFYRGRDARLADTEGMGIGLYMSKEIIERHHGKIWADSEGAGKGSTFAFSVPAAKQ